MRSLSRILLPVDFSERSAGAARYAKALAAHFGSELTLLHVLTPPQYEFGALDIGGSMLADLYRSRAEQAKRELEGFLGDELRGPGVHRVIEEGDPARRIVEFAREHCDVIVMPTHGYGPFRHFILGSSTAKVLHDADCPVWTGVHLADPPAPISLPLRRILCAIDLGPQSARTLCWASWLAGQFAAELTLLHVTACASDVPEATCCIDLRNAARQELARLQESHGARADLVVESGEAPGVICAAAALMGADVLVIGRGSAAGVFGRLRTNAYAIIRQSPCPVISV